jgi:predicted aminopeptidase
MSERGISHPPITILAAFFASCMLPACSSLTYYGQAIDGQMEITKKQEDNTKLLADPATSTALKRQLELIEELRTFSSTQLHLPAGKNYTAYADLGRPHVVWSVFATPEFSLEPKRWWYPVVGKLSYRGFFEESAAREEARTLEEQGYDVFVGEVDAYSTLGWFNDPVLNTFVNEPDSELAELIFHELTHRKIYLSNSTDFNEALATAVAEEGVRRWLRSQNRLGELADYERTVKRRRTVFALIDQSRKQLEQLYDQTAIENADLRRRKAVIFGKLAQDHRQLLSAWGQAPPNDNIGEVQINNAFLNAVDTYHRLIPQFESLLAEHEGNLASFFDDVKRRQNQLTTPDD